MRTNWMKRIVPRLAVLVVILAALIVPMFSSMPVWAAGDNHWTNVDGGNWSAGANWSLGHAPDATENALFDCAFNAGKTVTVDAAASCLNMDWTGAANSPTLTTSAELYTYGNVTFIAAMTINGTSGIRFYATAPSVLTTNGVTLGGNGTLRLLMATTLTLADAVNTNRTIQQNSGEFITAGHNVTTTGTFNPANVAGGTLTPSSSTITCGDFTPGANAYTLTANTATINVTGTGAFAGGAIATYNNINLNGTAHTVSGAFTCATLTRNGTATTTDTLTLTSGTTLTCTTFVMKGNSATNRLLVQSSTLGSPATITATNWTGTANVDIMDITATNAVDLSAITGLSGDCGGNTGITFTVAAAQTSASTDTWSTAAKWTSRVPLPQDDVTCSHNSTIDMPRIGKSITFTGTPTVTLGANRALYGSLTLVSGMTYTDTANTEFRGRGVFTVTSAGKQIYSPRFYAPTGKYTLQDDMVAPSNLRTDAGDLDFNGKSVTVLSFSNAFVDIARTVTLTGTLTLTDTGAVQKFYKPTNATLVVTSSTIVLTSSLANAQTFTGGGATYNNLTIQGAGAYALTISGSNTFNTVYVDASQAVKTLIYTDTTTQTVSDFKRDNGTNNIFLQGTGAAGWAMTATAGDNISLDYLQITNSTVLPVNTWTMSLVM